jgi:hypothetical protein
MCDLTANGLYSARIKGIKSRQVGWYPEMALSEFNDYFDQAMANLSEGQEG